MAPGNPPLHSMAAGAAKIMASQLAAKIITFGMNLLVARHLPPEAYGLSAIQYHLLTTSILQVSREGFRRGCLRVKDQEDRKDSSISVAERVLAVSWLCLPWGLAVAGAVCCFVLWKTAGSADSAYLEGVVLHGIAALIELCAEPLYVIASTQLAFGVRAAIDTAANLAKCVLTMVMVLATQWPPALIFSAASLAYSSLILAGYLIYGWQLRRQGKLSWPRHKWDAEDKQILHLSGIFTFQAVEKLLLAEGSKLALVSIETSYNQGVFGLVSNLGSLVVRLIFAPFEEVAFTAFSRAGITAKGNLAEQQQLAGLLSVLVRGVTILGLLAVSFGPWYSYTLLWMVYGSRWSSTEAPFVLGCYTCYILVMAVNGITEAFAHAVLDASALKQSNALLVVFTVAHMAVSVVMVKAAGAAGLVLADALNMVLRISFSTWYIGRYFNQLPGYSVSTLLPSSKALAGFLLATVLAGLSNNYFLGQSAVRLQRVAAHVGVGMAVLAWLLVWVYRSERATLQQLLSLRRQKGVKES